jgi:hypothetical protein
MKTMTKKICGIACVAVTTINGNGISHEVYQDANGRAIVRTVDTDAGEVVGFCTFKTVDEAIKSCGFDAANA